jgi:uncharacterized protein YoaH (UPF0181 family)
MCGLLQADSFDLTAFHLDHKRALRDAIQAARHFGLSSGEIIQIVEVEFTKTEDTSSANKKAIRSEDEVWNPLTEDLKKSKQ